MNRKLNSFTKFGNITITPNRGVNTAYLTLCRAYSYSFIKDNVSLDIDYILSHIKKQTNEAFETQFNLHEIKYQPVLSSLTDMSKIRTQSCELVYNIIDYKTKVACVLFLNNIEDNLHTKINKVLGNTLFVNK